MFDSSWWLGLAAALLFFWGVGGYNRLVRLRAAVISQRIASACDRSGRTSTGT